MKERHGLAKAKQIYNRPPKAVVVAKVSLAMVVLVSLCTSALAQENTAEDWYKKGQELERSGSWDEAVNAYNIVLNLTNESLKNNPQDAGLWQIKGLTFEKLNKVKEANKAFDQAVQLNPNNAESWLHKGRTLDVLAYGLQGQDRIKALDDAIQAYNQALKLDPNYGDAWKDRGYTLITLANLIGDLDKYNQSIQSFDKAIKLIPINDTTSLALSWEGKALALTSRGNALADLARSSRSEAIQCYDKAIELDPNFTGHEARLNKAGVLADLGRYNESVAAYEMVIENMPDNMTIYASTVWADMGSILEKMGDHGEALKAFDRSIELYPENTAAWKVKGDALNNTGRYDEAVKAYDKAIELSP